MEKLIHFSFYNGEKIPFALKIKTRNTLALETINQWEKKLDLKSINTEPDIALSLNGLHKKPIHFKTKNSRINYLPLDRFNKFILYSKKGSFIKTDIQKKTAAGSIVKRDPYKFALLDRWLNYCIVFCYQVHLHAARIIHKEKGSSILFIGKNGAGKSTICDLLSKNENFEVIHDDFTSIYPRFNKINIIYHIRYLRDDDIFSVISPHRINRIFFINKDTSLGTRIDPLVKKEAFKKIVFASEFPAKENKLITQNRLNTLSRLVKQCRCYSLINGKGLKENPTGLSRLLLSAIKR